MAARYGNMIFDKRQLVCIYAIRLSCLDQKEQSQESPGSNTFIWIAVAVAIPLCVVIVILIIFLYRRSQSGKTIFTNPFSAPNRLYNERLAEEELLADWPSYDNLQFDRKYLEIIGILGEGNFGKVYKAKAQSILEEEETLVAIKTTKNKSLAGPEEFKKELDIMMQFNHPNILKLLGVCTTQFPLYMIFEIMTEVRMNIMLLQIAH